MRDRLIEKVFEWDLVSSPQALWPLISDTARMNQALGLPPYDISETFDENSIRRRYGQMIEDEQRVRWEEPPFEWVENGWWRWRRFYDEGPLRETGGILMLMPGKNNGTHVNYTLSVDPNGALGRMLIASGHLKLAARSFRKFTTQLDKFCQKPFGDFYSNLAATTTKKSSRKLPKPTSDEEKLLNQFAEWLAVAPFADRVDLRSKRLARCMNVSESEALRVCLRAVVSGDLTMRYRAVCATCRASAIEVDSLSSIPPLMACRRCGSGFHRDLDGSVEVLFSVAKATQDEGTFCGSGPSNAPYVLVQQNLGAMERRDLVYELPPGTYLARAVDGPVSEPFEIAERTCVTITLTSGISVALTTGGSVIENHSKRDYTLAIERCGSPESFLTVAELLAEQCFHDIMPDQALPDGDTASIEHGVILGIGDLDGALSEARKGAIVEQDSVYRALYFASVSQALETAETLIKAHPEARFGMDCGPLTLATVRGRMRFIGTVAETAQSLCLGGHRGVLAKSPRIDTAKL